MGSDSVKAIGGQQCTLNGCNYPTVIPRDQYDYPSKLNDFTPGTPLDSNEMRITFMGSGFPPSKPAQQMMSIFVEVGDAMGEADQFVFDCGSGVISNYTAMEIPYGRMDKVFITHLHGDHMSDLSAIYCFGPSEDRKSPLYVWGPSRSGVESPKGSGKYYNDGTKAFCESLRKAMRWHTESFSFLPTSYKSYKIPTKQDWGLPCKPKPVGNDSPDDGFALVPIELKWRQVGGVAYDNKNSGVRITHFPVIHCRQGSIGYKLEWNGLTMIYTSDTRPETNCIEQAKNIDPMTGEARGVDVFIHEMILPPELMATKGMRLPAPDYADPNFDASVYFAKTVIESSHTPQGALGYILSQINPHPKLSVITHCPVADDAVACALKSVQAHCPWAIMDKDNPNASNIIWSTDLMVLRVHDNHQIEQLRGNVNDYIFSPPTNVPTPLNTAKYSTKAGLMDPTQQLDLSTFIEPGDDTWCKDGY
ncbi:MAG: MBL fold metallo-hydrolase [Nitrospirota bacterium]